MSRRAQENLAALAFLLLFAGIIVLSLDFGPRARMIPVPLAIGGVVLTLIQIVWQNLRSTDDLQIDLMKVLVARDPGSPQAEPSPEAAAKKASSRREAGAFGIVIVLLVLTLALGPIPAIFLFTGGYFVVSGHYSWLRSFIYTAIFTAVVYLLFVVALEIQLYHGLLTPLIERLRG
jgi:hypothetical protein